MRQAGCDVSTVLATFTVARRNLQLSVSTEATCWKPRRLWAGAVETDEISPVDVCQGIRALECSGFPIGWRIREISDSTDHCNNLCNTLALFHHIRTQLNSQFALMPIQFDYHAACAFPDCGQVSYPFQICRFFNGQITVSDNNR